MVAYPCPSAVSLQYICSVSAVSNSCALDRPAVHKEYHLKMSKSEQCMSSTLYFKWSAVLQEKYYVFRAEVSFEVQGSMFWSAAKWILRCTGIALQTDMGSLTSPVIMAPQRGVPQSPCNILNFWTIILCDVSKTTYKFFARDLGPQSICMYLSIPSRDILSPKSKYCNGFDIRPHNDWSNPFHHLQIWVVRRMSFGHRNSFFFFVAEPAEPISKYLCWISIDLTTDMAWKNYFRHIETRGIGRYRWIYLVLVI